MRVVAVAVDEEGEEEEEEEEEDEKEEKEEEEEEEEKETQEPTVKEQERYTGHYGVHGPAMRLATTTAVENKNSQSATACSIFCVSSSPPLLLLLLLLLLLPTLILTIVVDASPLHPTPPHKDITFGSYIKYYEVATYDTAALRQYRNRIRRNVADPVDEQPLILHLKTLERFWTIRLVHDASLFSKDATFEGTNGPISFDSSHSYVGTVLEDENAVVQGVVTKDGLFDGSVVTRFEEYYIEPTSRYLNKNENTSPSYHSIAYRTSDVIIPPYPLSCASHQLHQETLRDSFDRYRHNNSEAFYEPLFVERDGSYLKENNARVLKSETNDGVAYADEMSGRDRIARHLHKRATVDPRKTTCMLYLQADHQFFARYGTEEACIEVMTRHVQRVNSIYKHTAKT